MSHHALYVKETSDDQWEHEVDIVPPIVGKEAVLGCNGLGEACPVGV